MRIAETLRDRLPRVAAIYLQGRLSSRVISAITWRTRLITDDDVWAQIDGALAERVQTWGPLADDKLDRCRRRLVYRFDRDAVIASRTVARSRDFTVGYFDDEAGLTSIWGKLLAPDAAVLDRKVSAMVATVCDNDPRTRGERRADALGALANGNDHLPCACGSSTCPVAADQPAPRSSVVVHVTADQTALDAARALNSSRTRSATDLGTAILSGTDVLPTPMLAELLRNGARLRPLCSPDEEPEPGYRSLGQASPPRASTGSDMPISRLHDARRVLRHRPRHPISDRRDASLEPGLFVPETPPPQDLLGR